MRTGSVCLQITWTKSCRFCRGTYVDNNPCRLMYVTIDLTHDIKDQPVHLQRFAGWSLHLHLNKKPVTVSICPYFFGKRHNLPEILQADRTVYRVIG